MGHLNSLGLLFSVLQGGKVRAGRDPTSLGVPCFWFIGRKAEPNKAMAGVGLELGPWPPPWPTLSTALGCLSKPAHSRASPRKLCGPRRVCKSPLPSQNECHELRGGSNKRKVLSHGSGSCKSNFKVSQGWFLLGLRARMCSVPLSWLLGPWRQPLTFLGSQRPALQSPPSPHKALSLLSPCLASPFIGMSVVGT